MGLNDEHTTVPAPDGETPPWNTGIEVPSESKLPEWLAVLCVAGITYHLSRRHAVWIIHLAPEHEDAARALIDDHEARHRDWPPRPLTETSAPGLWFDNLWAGFWGVYTVALFYLWQGPYRVSNALLRAGGAQRSAIRAGEWWRTVTALMIHADAGHLVSNLLFVFCFAALVVRLYGSGVGWLLIVVAGGLGNGLVAVTATRDGVGVGASTACFGALGLLVIHGLIARLQRAVPWRERWYRAWLPLMGGLAMLSMTGASPGTDVVAHLFGFLAGMTIGLPFAAGFPRQPLPRPAQWLALAGVLGLVSAAWWLAA